MTKNIFYRIIFTLSVIFCYHVLGNICVPCVLPEEISAHSSVINVFRGGLKDNSIFHLGSMPFILSSMVISMLTFIVPYLKNLSKQGLQGRQIIDSITRTFSIIFTIFSGIHTGSMFIQQDRAVFSFYFYFLYITSLLSANAFIIWISDKLSEYGFGSGMSIIITSNIIKGSFYLLNNQFLSNKYNIIGNVLLILFLILAESFTINISVLIPKYFAYKNKDYVFDKIIDQESFLPIKVSVPGITSAFVSTSAVSICKNFINITANVEVMLIILLIFITNVGSNYLNMQLEEISSTLIKNGCFVKNVRPGNNLFNIFSKLIVIISIIATAYIVFVIYGVSAIFNYFDIQPLFCSNISVLIIVSTVIDLYKYIVCHYKQSLIQQIK